MNAVSSPRSRIMVVTPLGEGGRGGIDRIMDEIRVQLSEKPPADLTVSFYSTRGQGHILRSIPLVAITALRLLLAPFGFGPDLVHINLAQDGSTLRKLLVARVARFVGVPYIIHLHGSRFRSSWAKAPPVLVRRMQRLFGYAAHTLVLGTVWKEFILQHAPKAEGRIEIFPNASPAAEPAVRETRDHVVILFLGYIGERKGAPQLVEALATMKSSPDLEQGPQWRAIIAGNGDVEETRARVESLGLADRVTLPGWVGPEEVSRLLSQADILVLPSFDENLPMSVIEGMAHGLAVAATPVGAVEDILHHEKTGLITPTGDAPALAKTLERLVLDPDLRARLGAAAKAYHTEHLEMGAYYRKLLDVWRRFARRSAAASSGAS